MSDRAKEGLLAFVRQAFPLIDYLALYPAQIRTQNADGTLELTPDDARISGLSKVVIRHGLPGVAVKVNAGARCLVGFENGDPQKPVATLWEVGSIDKLYLGTSNVTGSDATDFVAMAAKVNARLDAIQNALASHSHALQAGPYPGSTTSVIGAATGSNSVGSAIVKVK